MATIVLSAAGMALGSSVGGTVLGLSAATIGRAVGAVVGRRIDERILGAGSDPVETGRVDRFRLTGASEGSPTVQVAGRMRVAGQVIWASRFEESSETTGGGKGPPSGPKTTTFSYSVSMAVALCHGEITHVGRIWADGVEISPDGLNMRVYHGSADQQPDPKIEVVEGQGTVPAYRGMAYVVLEDVGLGQFGNRVPQLSFEVFRPAPLRDLGEAGDLARLVQGVALIPGTGEYSLATTPVFLSSEFGEQVAINSNSASGKTDFATSLADLDGELPECGSVSLVVSWFGDDLRCGECLIKPKIEQNEVDSEQMPWRVSGLDRGTAELVPQDGGRPVYGGTPADAAVIEAIVAINDAGKDVVYYPFILMEQMAGNTLVDPYSGAQGQSVLPWRGRITTALAPTVAGTTDGTTAAEAEVAAFFGLAAAGDFDVSGGVVNFTGTEEWSFRRSILHQAHLCAAAGGVAAFCIGSEMRGLTQILGASGNFPAVDALRVLAADVRSILGPECKISYAADWSEYHGYQPAGTGDKLFHLDPLWADPNIDFIGIDNYMPLSDWRDEDGHLDADAGSIYDLEYLTGNVAGGEGYDWYYHSTEARNAQVRTPISDGEGEPWVWRYKDIKGWWSHEHHERIGGVRQETPTVWEPESKPIWFTEFGCAAINKGTNQPNKFLDPKSSESTLPHYSNGMRDDYMQMQYMRAVHRHFAGADANPVSEVYDGPMVDMSRAHVWAWDARPFPQFPANGEMWSDGGNYTRGHWLNGRSTSRSLASLMTEICAASGVTQIDTRRLHGVVRGFRFDDTDTARSAIQTLMVAYGFDVIERDGILVFRTRGGADATAIEDGALALDEGLEATLEVTRAAEAEVTGRVQLSYIEAEGDYDVSAAEAVFPGDAQNAVAASEVPLALTRGESVQMAERWLAEARVGRETARLALPPSAMKIGAGDVVALAGQTGRYRIDRVESGAFQSIEAVRVEPEVYRAHEAADDIPTVRATVPATPVEAVFLDLPLLSGDEVPHAPHLAVAARPWPGNVALYGSATDGDYTLNRLVEGASVVGTTLNEMRAAEAGRWDHGVALQVKLVRGALSSADVDAVLSGRNVAAIGDGQSDVWEVFQFAAAELVAPRTYHLRLRLRGQAGTDGVMPDVWPAGSRFVLLNERPKQIDLVSSARDVARHYRIGVADRPFTDPTYSHEIRAFRGVGLRPYPVCHLSSQEAGGDLFVSWIRRTRLGGDAWGAGDVPLSEAAEAYAVRVKIDGVVMRDAQVSAPEWTYDAAMRNADGAGVTVIEVAQLSDQFGAGPYRALSV